MDVSHSVYSLSSWWTFGLFPLFAITNNSAVNICVPIYARLELQNQTTPCFTFWGTDLSGGLVDIVAPMSCFLGALDPYSLLCLFCNSHFPSFHVSTVTSASKKKSKTKQHVIKSCVNKIVSKSEWEEEEMCCHESQST